MFYFPRSHVSKFLDAASDAYAALSIFNVLEEKRMSLDPAPKFPECRVIPTGESLSEEDTTPDDQPDEMPKTFILDNLEIERASYWAGSYRKDLASNGREPKALHSQLKAYALWHGGRDVKQIARLWRDPPLKTSTVVMYLLEAIRLEGLPYRKERLAEVVKYIPRDFAGANGRYYWAYMNGVDRDTDNL
jgi:hypothetical protein